jgi:hypothetical protein
MFEEDVALITCASCEGKKMLLVVSAPGESVPPPPPPNRAGIFKHSKGARNRVGIGLSFRLARPHRLAEFIPWNLFLGFINV